MCRSGINVFIPTDEYPVLEFLLFESTNEVRRGTWRKAAIGRFFGFNSTCPPRFSFFHIFFPPVLYSISIICFIHSFLFCLVSYLPLVTVTWRVDSTNWHLCRDFCLAALFFYFKNLWINRRKWILILHDFGDHIRNIYNKPLTSYSVGNSVEAKNS